MTTKQKHLLTLCLNALTCTEEIVMLEKGSFLAAVCPGYAVANSFVWPSVALWSNLSLRIMCRLRRNPRTGEVVFIDALTNETFHLRSLEYSCRAKSGFDLLASEPISAPTLCTK